MHMTRKRVAVAGASGYAGGEVLRLLLAHPEVEIGALTGGSNAGESLGALQPHLVPLADRVLEPTNAETLAGHDVVFLGLPHGQSGAIAAAARRRRRGHRLRRRLPADRPRGVGHRSTAATTPAPGPTGSPSCPASATSSAARGGSPCPAATRRSPRSPWPRPSPPGSSQPDVVVVAASGTSGAGKAAKPHLLGSEIMGNASAYGVGGTHRHTPEITQNLSLLVDGTVTVSFTPLLVPMPRGILATCSAPLAGAAHGRRGVRRLRQGLRRRAVRAPAARRGSGRRPSR